MALQKPDWFKINPSQFLTDSQVDAMTTEELGACFRLLCRQWIDGILPDDVAVLGRFCRLESERMASVWLNIQRFFPKVENGRANRFMFLQREEVQAEMARKSGEGSKAARKRWDDLRKSKDAIPNASPNAGGNGSGMPLAMQESDTDSETESELPPPSGGGSLPKKPKREPKPVTGLDYPPETMACCAKLWNSYPKEWPDQGDVPKTRMSDAMARTHQALAQIHKLKPQVPAETLLEEALRVYLAESRTARSFVVGLGVWLSPNPINGPKGEKANYRVSLPLASHKLARPEVAHA